jgi:hypothetical protein
MSNIEIDGIKITDIKLDLSYFGFNVEQLADIHLTSDDAKKLYNMLKEFYND